IMGTVFINEKTISLIDLYTIIEAQNIGGFNRKADTDLNKNKNKTILVVDDSPMYRKLEADLLLSMGFTVETANHGGEGFDMISNKEYDLLITDIEMPVLDGFEFVDKIRNELNNMNLPILALSTRVSEKDIARGKEVGFDWHMEKFKKDLVMDKVLNILGEK
ncbi:MAG: response regulator, partial [Halobacteriovoraceae bacterium]|nr:response regulator [Halobacteriovoraceae bacterium]